MSSKPTTMSAALDRANPPRANPLSRSRASPTVELIKPSGGAKSSTHVYHMQIPDSQSGGYQAACAKTLHGRIDSIRPAIPATFRLRMIFPLPRRVISPIVPAADRHRVSRISRIGIDPTENDGQPPDPSLYITWTIPAAQPLFPAPVQSGWPMSAPEAVYDLRGFSSSALCHEQDVSRNQTVSHAFYGSEVRGDCSGSGGFGSFAASAHSSYSTSAGSCHSMAQPARAPPAIIPGTMTNTKRNGMSSRDQARNHRKKPTNPKTMAPPMAHALALSGVAFGLVLSRKPTCWFSFG